MLSGNSLRSRSILAVVSLGVALAAPRPAAATQILDSFDEANDPTTLNCVATTICTPVGGSVAVLEDYPPTTRTSQLTDDSSLTIDGSGSLTYSANSSASQLLLHYALGDQDITDSGANIGFVLSVLSVSGITAANVTMTDDNGNVSAVVPITPLAFGDNLVFYTSFFDADFDVTSLQNIDVISVHFPDGQMGSIELSEIQVPEPSTAGMLLLGLAGLTCARRAGQLGDPLQR
jgi:hypothetical protein